MKRLVVAVGGASGAPYAVRVLRQLCAQRDRYEVHLVFTKMGRLVWGDEVGIDPASFELPIYAPGDLTAPFASGSAQFDGMIIVPCSASGLGRVAHGVSSDLVGRAAEVMLKERRPLVMVLRESPYSLVHLRNMVAITEAGGVVMPASPSFYSRPQTTEALLDTVVSRALDLLGVDNALSPRWSGRQRPGAS